MSKKAKKKVKKSVKAVGKEARDGQRLIHWLFQDVLNLVIEDDD